MLRVKLDTENAAFEDDGLRVETARILRQIADKIEEGAPLNLYQTILDINGNACGRYRLTDPENAWRDIPGNLQN